MNLRSVRDGAELILEYNSSGGIARRFVHGPGVDEPLVWYGSGGNKRRFFHADERGSIVAATDSAAALVGINRYDEYGAPQSTNIGRFYYTGQAWYPELGLIYYKNRWRHPKLDRFMQTDPIGYGAGMNMYAYVGGDPVNFIDPMGLKKESEKEDDDDDNEATVWGWAPGGGGGGGGGGSWGGIVDRTADNLLNTGEALENTADVVVETIVITGKTLKVAGRAATVPTRMSWYPLRWVGWKLGFNRKPGSPLTVTECGCFEAGTLVSTPGGSRPIEDIEVGDMVLSVNEETGQIAAKPVTDLIRPEPKPLYALSLLDASGEVERFHATDDHPWKVQGKGWVETADLTAGDRVETGSGADMMVTSLSLTDRVEKTYNLTVAEWHTFMVGEDGAIVHNQCDDDEANPQKKGTPGNNQAQNRVFRHATRGLNKAQKRTVHDIITGGNYTYHEILEIAEAVKNGNW